MIEQFDNALRCRPKAVALTTIAVAVALTTATVTVTVAITIVAGSVAAPTTAPTTIAAFTTTVVSLKLALE